MTSTKILSWAELNHKATSALQEDKFRRWAELLLTAINDWPATNLIEPSDFLKELNREIKTPLSFDNLTKYSEGLAPGIEGNAWKMESIASLLEMFNIDNAHGSYKELTLDAIIENLTEHCRE